MHCLSTPKKRAEYCDLNTTKPGQGIRFLGVEFLIAFGFMTNRNVGVWYATENEDGNKISVAMLGYDIPGALARSDRVEVAFVNGNHFVPVFPRNRQRRSLRLIAS